MKYNMILNAFMRGIDFYFSDYYKVEPEIIEKYGAFNISLATDLPLFIDPFLLFNSSISEYKALHTDIIDYLTFLKDKSQSGELSKGLIQAWFLFPEVKENWFGFCKTGNQGNGLSYKFAYSLRDNLSHILKNFGKEKITIGTHLEKLCLINKGVGKDHISDFTTNLIKKYLLEYTENFVKIHIKDSLLDDFNVRNVTFNYSTESWETRKFRLPAYNNSYVLLTPKDLLAKDDTWINRNDMMRKYHTIPISLSNEQLREQVNNYLLLILPKYPSKKDEKEAMEKAIIKYPQLIDYFINEKEEKGNDASKRNIEIIAESEKIYYANIKLFDSLLNKLGFYKYPDNTYDEAMERVKFLKHIIEDQDGYKLFYINGQPIKKESDLHILFKLTWWKPLSDISSETNSGRGPVDFKISRGSKDRTLVEFKLARNSHLKNNLKKQVEIYQKAEGIDKALKVILYFYEEELDRVNSILTELGLIDNENIVLIDARSDNKPSGSKAK